MFQLVTVRTAVTCNVVGVETVPAGTFIAVDSCATRLGTSLNAAYPIVAPVIGID